MSILYLDGIEQLDPMSGIEPTNPRIDVKDYTDLERQKAYEAAKDYYSGLNIKWYWHLCSHEDNRSCTVTEVI